MSSLFPTLFSPFRLGTCDLANRIVSTGHHSYLTDGAPNAALIAYHEARARGGAGLIISEIVAVHETAGFSTSLLRVEGPDALLAYRRLTAACQRHGARIFAQLFHPGREVLATQSGLLPVAWAPSAVPNERFHIMPRALPPDLIASIVKGYAHTAASLVEAGFDGVEIVASHGYLPAQFLNPRVNLREDTYGGAPENRLRFLRETLSAVRTAVGMAVVGLRISGSEMDAEGLTAAEVLEACQALAPDLDYLSVVAGTSASLGSSTHIVPPMGLEPGYVAPFASAIKRATGKPILVTGRINQPHSAEQILESGAADLCGMTRAMICDPAMAEKARTGRQDEIRACIGCNQACIGRAHKGLGISCIQYPESGRELRFSKAVRTGNAKRVLVAGGGPGGMKAAAVAAARGHAVTLYEAESQLGGQVRLAQGLPGREEFGGLATNLEGEMLRAGVTVRKGRSVTEALLLQERPDLVIDATGAKPYVPPLEGMETAITAWDLLAGKVRAGTRAVIADWRADWIGLGLAEMLTQAGSYVTLCCNTALAGESLQSYTRNHWLARLHRQGVEIRTHARLFALDGDTAYFQDSLSEEAVIFEDVDSLVLALGHRSNAELAETLDRLDCPLVRLGDALAPRTAEEAVYEGLEAGWSL